jgi:hypothetical protein
MSSVAWALLLFVLTSCRQPCFLAGCFTRCGTYSCSDRCTELQEAEDRAVAVYEDAGYRTCAALGGFDIEVQRTPDGGPAVHWIDEYQRDIAGDTSCGLGRIRLGTDSWRLSAYSHEVMHVSDGCATPDHENWLDGGIFLLVEEAQ